MTTMMNEVRERDEMPADPVEAFLHASMLPSHLVNLDEVIALRRPALNALEDVYGRTLSEDERVPDSRRGAREATPDIVREIPDAVHRYMLLGELSARGWQKHEIMDHLRTMRAQAIQVLKYDYDWGAMRIVRALGSEERRIVQFADDASDKTQRPTSWSEERALHTAQRAHAAYVRYQEYAIEVRPDRDRMVHELAEGRWLEENGSWRLLGDEEMQQRQAAGEPVGRRFTNAQLARLGSLTTAMVAQIRMGVTPAARRAAAQA